MSTILVTGAGGGIGSGIVEAAQAAGHEVFAHGRRLESVQAFEGRGVTVLAGDLRDEESRCQLVDRVGDQPLDAVIATHGVTGAIELTELTRDSVRELMMINTVSVIELAILFSSHLRAAGGTFVAVSSQAGIRAERGNSAYCASKWALVEWAREAQADQAERGFAIRALCPGRTDAPMLHAANSRLAATQGLSTSEYEALVSAKLPLGRIASVAEVAATALFQAAPMAALRPTILPVTGGEVPQ